MPNPRAVVLWDFGNVIVRWNPRTLYSKIFPDSAILRSALEAYGVP